MLSNPHLSSAILKPHKQSGLPLPNQHRSKESLLGLLVPAPASASEGESAALQPALEEAQVPSEEVLTHRIEELWAEHTEHTTVVKCTRSELASIRAELAAQLSKLKEQLARPGRNGNWNAFLKSKRIPRITADRYVERHRAVLKFLNGATEATNEPTPTEVTAFVNKLTPKLRARLTTSAAVTQFLDEITVILSAPPARKGGPLAA